MNLKILTWKNPSLKYFHDTEEFQLTEADSKPEVKKISQEESFTVQEICMQFLRDNLGDGYHQLWYFRDPNFKQNCENNMHMDMFLNSGILALYVSNSYFEVVEEF